MSILSSWPQAILHVDGDAFFASCEQAVHPEWRGKPLVTGKERRIITAASYEAKALGISRGTPLWEAIKICPELIVVSSDYELYARISQRMYAIIRRFTPFVEEYSIDEAFADITGLHEPLRLSYETFANNIKESIERELSITVSVGVSLSKVLAKVASKWNKPSGLTLIPVERIQAFLATYPVEKLWGIGSKMSFYCHRFGIRTALELAEKSEGFMKDHFDKPQLDIWRELNGVSALPVHHEQKEDPKSISKFQTFTPPSSDPGLLFSHLLKNLENACRKARRYKLVARQVVLLLRTQSFRNQGYEIILPQASAYPPEMSAPLKKGFEKIFRSGESYRATGIVLSALTSSSHIQTTLFDTTTDVRRWERAYAAIDQLNKKFGSSRIHLATHLDKQKPLSPPSNPQPNDQAKRLSIPTLTSPFSS